jgi:multidrug efflux pump subunit AcrA (membrane-fusion protein)
MFDPKDASHKARRDRVTLRFTARVIATVLVLSGCGRASDTSTSSDSGRNPNASQSENSVDLSADQLSAIKIEPVGTYLFTVEKSGIGNVDFDNKLYFDNNLSTQVFAPREGKIVNTLAELGDEVQKGQPLYTISGPGEREFVVGSPITGQVTAVNASPGLQVQPGKPPAPYAVADVSTKWMVGNVLESDSPLFQVGQSVEVRAMAYPGRVFEGKIIKIYPTVDGTTHRVMIRSQIADPKNELRSGMLAEFIIRVQSAMEAPAIPPEGVVREGDGTMTAWVTKDRHHFTQKVIKTGLREDDRVQVLEGLERGELVVTNGAVFLSNMLQAPPTD